ncbi:MAG: metal ABC transporter substrate-binding protein [Myxococcota bacterium]
MTRNALLALVCWLGSLAVPVVAEIRVVTTSPALADLTRQVAGPEVEVQALMRGPENPHNVVPKPSFVMKLRKADLFVHLGLDAEPWVPALVRGARREHLLPGGAGNIDASRGIPLAEIPSRGGLSRALGDIHVYGNTHYLLDPLNGVIAARTIAEALARVDPARAEEFRANADGFAARIRDLTERLTQRMEPYAGTAVVTYHRTWPYFLRRFRLEKIGEVEPKPGIAPGPRHVLAVAEEMTRRGVKVVIVETFSNHQVAQRVAERAEGRALVLAQEVRSLPQVDSYEALFEYNVTALIETFRELEPAPAGNASP